jgi:hypothetical protein
MRKQAESKIPFS